MPLTVPRSYTTDTEARNTIPILKKPSPIRKAFHYPQYLAFRALMALLHALSDQVAYGLARALGSFVWTCLRIRRQVTMANLGYAFGTSLDAAGRARLGHAAYRQIAMTFFEMLRVSMYRTCLHEMVDNSEIVLLRQALGQGRGVILVIGHYGSWELGGASLAAAGLPVTVATARQSNPYVTRYVNAWRMAFGVHPVSSGASIRQLVAALKNNEVVVLASDQNAGKRGVFVDFFGRPASTPPGPAQLALRYGAPLIVGVTKRLEPGRFKNIVQAVEIGEDATVESITQSFTTILENIIRQAPEQYMWMHRRWKTRPGAVRVNPRRGGETAEGKPFLEQ